MFCNQCEQTANCTGCVTSPGVCGKDEDVQSLQETLLYGLKGMCAYASHARRLGKSDEAVNAFVEEALFATMTNVNFDIGAMLELVLECGKQNLRVMELLDQGHVDKFGQPSPAPLQEGTQAGPGILVSGHDLLDLDNLLKQCEGTDVKVYTHGEMLPAHMYPKLREHPNLAGHYGGAWQKQRREFEAFSGPIVMTTNCVVIPRESYSDRLYTMRVTAVPDGKRVVGDDFSAVIAQAKQSAPLPEALGKKQTIGFHHDVILNIAGTIVDAVKAGKISRFFLIGGCDGAEVGRNYFSDYAQATPADSFILTLGCGKFRIRDYDYGELLGLPRLLDMGQCNNAYGAIKVATGLASAFNCSVNDLPLTLVVSWFEQKAVAVLLTLLHLGVKGITIGPKPPAFVTPNVFQVLQQKFDLRLTGADPKADLQAAMAG
ncbi:MAG: hydroxylamine reductase [Pirellulaceae bacterium]|jgi:hydroxylamine reductase|nr:hydroxylamine reductase [Thermoguttaceae bacterium]NLY99009.1 hydroxylamine reductase [Pirellulaceae bacterium]